MKFWPGDNVKLEEISGEDYKRKSAIRLQRVRDFISSEGFGRELAICFAGSVPRWHEIRIIERDEVEPNRG